MEKIGNRAILKTNTEYRIDDTNELFFIMRNNRNDADLSICSSDIPPDAFAYIYEHIDSITEICPVAICYDDRNFYPDEYLDLSDSTQYYIDDNGMIMPKHQWELTDEILEDWMDSQPDIEIYGEIVRISIGDLSRWGIYPDVSNRVLEDCLNNEEPDIIEFFDNDDSRVTDWLTEHDQIPTNVSIRNDGKCFLLTDEHDKIADELTHACYYFINQFMESKKIDGIEIYQTMLSIISEN